MASFVNGKATEYTPKLPERLAHDNTVWPQTHRADRVFVRSAASLYHGQRTVNRTLVFKKAQEQERVAQVAEIERWPRSRFE